MISKSWADVLADLPRLKDETPAIVEKWLKSGLLQKDMEPTKQAVVAWMLENQELENKRDFYHKRKR